MAGTRYNIAKLKAARISRGRNRFLIHHGREIRSVDLSEYTVVITAEEILTIKTEEVNVTSLRPVRKPNENDWVRGDRRS